MAIITRPIASSTIANISKKLIHGWDSFVEELRNTKEPATHANDISVAVGIAHPFNIVLYEYWVDK